MAAGKGKSLDWGNLRHQAEVRLRDRKLAANLPLRDPDRAVHELEVHQTELEMQNEELREARLELENLLVRYTEIFDFAPIGYVTITLDGTIRELNHAAATLIGGVRSRLTGTNFSGLVTARQRAHLSEVLRLCLVNEARESCQLELLRIEGTTTKVHLMATVLARAEPLVLLTLQEPMDPSLTANSDRS